MIAGAKSTAIRVGRMNTISGTVGQGPQINLTTDRGNVTLKKAGAPSETPAVVTKPQDTTAKSPQAIKTEQQ